ncbi:TetR/AcrR family transcriptional regulator [Glutamicibacter sp.]|uniref:TetR/AcrR family transcriptional regulator n=1 Tax=Glutamicibacter sp. TaxID=1931995 RepID=UPI0028BE4861|nr:TetR/AcrR family transcriptional regulator [Glutamicibacter sp.]
MRSSATKTRVRKKPEDRRLEILDTASQLALSLGLEKVTMKLVAEQLEVRPGLISHYFRTIDELICAAFEQAATGEREGLFAAEEQAQPLDAIRSFLGRVTAPEFSDLGKLWLDARHQSRYRPMLREVVATQEELTFRRLAEVIAQAVERRELHGIDPQLAATEILVVVDGTASYVNTSAPESGIALAEVIWRMSEQALGLPSGALHQ